MPEAPLSSPWKTDRGREKEGEEEEGVGVETHSWTNEDDVGSGEWGVEWRGKGPREEERIK